MERACLVREAYHPDTGGGGGGFWRPELWERVNLVDEIEMALQLGLLGFIFVLP